MSWGVKVKWCSRSFQTCRVKNGTFRFNWNSRWVMSASLETGRSSLPDIVHGSQTFRMCGYLITWGCKFSLYDPNFHQSTPLIGKRTKGLITSYQYDHLYVSPDHTTKLINDECNSSVYKTYSRNTTLPTTLCLPFTNKEIKHFR